MAFTLAAQDVEGPIRAKLEDWEDALTSAVKSIIEAEVQKVTNPTDNKGFVKALALMNWGKSSISAFGAGTGLATMVAAPEFAIPLALMGKVSEAMRWDGGEGARVKLIERDYDAMMEDFLKEVRLAEDTFPISPQGRELAKRVAETAARLRFDSVAVRNSWCLRFLENIGAIEVRDSVLKKAVADGFGPIFRTLSMIIAESLRSDKGKIPRWLGADPNWKWSGFDVHVPGTPQKASGARWPGAVGPGFRRATSDEIRDIVTNFWRYKITSRQIVVGAYGHSQADRIVECVPLPGAKKRLPMPPIGDALDAMFTPMRVQATLYETSRQVPSGVVELEPAYPDYQPGRGPLR